MFLTKKHLSRRTAIKGLGVTLALPMLEAMVPAVTAQRRTVAGAPRVRLACLEMVHGSAGATRFGAGRNLWSPAAAGRQFDLTPTSLKPLEPFRDYITIVSNTDCRMAEAFTDNEVGGDHNRSSAAYLTQSKPKQTLGSDIYAGVSMDQLYAQRFGQDSPLPSIQLAIESDDTGGCHYGYACVYMGPISWASPTRPLPAIRDPRMVFDQLFGTGGTPAERSARRRTDRSILDWITRDVARLKNDLGPVDQRRLDQYLDDVREIERRIQLVEAHNSTNPDLPPAPVGVPDSFMEHVQIMFDLQALAFIAGVTHVSSFKMSRDATGRTYPDSGTRTAFHQASHHSEVEAQIIDFARINTYHVSTIPYFLQKLKNAPEGDGTVLDNTLMIYGSPMGDSNLHNHRRCPLFLAGHAGGKLKGNQHVIAADGTPMANVFLRLLHGLGVDDIKSFGDSTGELELG
ncbi:MAG TPA: DUF1552 domain-containing protein [Vicinamibacterales bacterium]|nr:DUF1552 domain-containing protein [Vicinamibacterales bacterium]